MRIGIQNDLIELGSHYGLEYYLHMTTEESAELIQAINKIWRHNRKKENLGNIEELKDHLFEEIADVEICLGVLKNMLHCEEEVYTWKVNKIKRQKGRIKHEENITDG